jgi:hypothetical protein
VPEEFAPRRSEAIEERFITANERDVQLLAHQPTTKKQDSPPGHSLTFAGLFLFCFVLYVRPYEFFPQVPLLQSIALILALATLAVYVPTQLALEGKLTIRPREIKLLTGLLVIALLSVPLALDPMMAWNGFIDYFKVVLMFLVLINVVRTERRLRLLFLLVLIVSCVLAAGAVNDYMAGRLDLGGRRIKGMIGGMFDNPNDLALHLVTIIPIAIALVFSSRALRKKLFYLCAATLMTAGVVVTFSRGGFLAMFCMAAVLAWRVGQRHKWIIAMVLPVVLVAFIVFAPGGYRSRLATTNDDSSAMRLDDLKRSLFISAHHPLLGVGMSNYILFSNSNHATHNAYTQVSSELGATAMVIYVLFLIAPITKLRKIERETHDLRHKSPYYYLAIGLEASLIGYMVASFFASVAFLWYAYFLVGYAVCLRRLYYVSGENASPS